MNLSCLIVDDEPLAVGVLETHIQSIPRITVTGKCDNAFEAMEFLQKQNVDLIFLDIEMPLLTGTAFLRTLSHPPRVIFTTAHKEFAIDAFDLNAVDYLLKPVSLERLIRALNKIFTEPLQPAEEHKIIDQEGFIYLRSERKMIKVKYNDILYIESMKDYVKIVCTKDKPFLTKQSISSLEELLPAYLFTRIHRSFIVSVNKISAYSNNDVEIGSFTIPIGRSYLQQLEKIKSAWL